MKWGLKISTSGVLVLGAVLFLFCNSSCKQVPAFYSLSDFEKLEKIDAHFHYNVFDTRFLDFADSLNFKIVSPNTRSIDDDQFNITCTIKQKFPDRLAYFGTFSLENWGQPGFVEQTIDRIDLVMEAGASGIKIWKNIGMELRDSTGRYIMVDDPSFKPIFDYLENNDITVMGHLGEPKNCWLPFEEMTVRSNRDYYKNNPQYHMYLHPEAPSYEEHIAARDHMLEQHPGLNFIGAHLASLEWSVDELAERLDRFENLSVDMSARINHLQYQSLSNHDRVRDFIIKYQDRILYATDRGIRPQNTDLENTKDWMLERWKTGWLFLATDSVFQSTQVDNKMVEGLKLPKDVIDKIYYSNAEYLFTQSVN